MHLYIAYKNYSSWSLRPWIALKVAGIPFDETILPFYHSDALDKLGERYQIPAKVPVIEDQGLIIWDSLAMLEYVHEQYPEKKLWPEDLALRTLARSAAAEMHSSFNALRSQHPMNCRRHIKMQPSPEVQVELLRLAEIWAHFEKANKPAGDFLCGHFTIVDAMYAPVMWRAVGYGLEVSPSFKKWTESMLVLPAMQEWLAAAKAEEAKWTIAQYDEVGV
ncbi:glutathione S-transferase [uncultured Thiothrix sp.]|uniref:glutathione S-transferase n=1 Tax=uncultured Thiothrix sp. TaxID=223185 RepID=UPI00262AD5F2|nr:glutathione S-transferase [uncultured Thiothrix sp.]HMT93306.1 glutathione S-transferase [Thiolinea sp.]